MNLPKTAIPIPYDQIARFCEQHHIVKLWLFGSVLRDDFTPDSDVDVLVEFDPDHIPGWEFYAWGDELAEILGHPIDLGTPLDVEVTATIHLPAGTAVHIPTGTSVQRDFATYTSKYSAKDATLTATRHLNFILKEIPADRAADYNAFLRAVQNDESQVFTLERPDTPAAKPQTP